MPYFFLAFGLSLLFIPAVKSLAVKFKIVDVPAEARKKHARPVPLWGGVAVWLSFWLVAGYVVIFTDLVGENLPLFKLFWVFVASLILMALGVLDDKFSLNPKLRLAVSALAVAAAIAGGVGIDKITNPFGGIWYLDFARLGNWLIIADTLVFFWILGMTYTIKILDGLDGLAAGIVAIGALMIFFIASGARWHQSDVALLSLVFAGACLGFLVFNFYPAKIFLGESGGLFLGFMLGVLSVIAGGKFATALLVMALPVMDLARVIYVRVRQGRPVSWGDREHLHFQLVDMGLTQRFAVLIIYAVAVIFGLATLFLQSIGKVLVLLALLIVMLAVAVWLEKRKK